MVDSAKHSGATAYYVRTALLGLLAVPIGVSVLGIAGFFAAGFANMAGSRWEHLVDTVMALLAAAVVFVPWYRRGRTLARRTRDRGAAGTGGTVDTPSRLPAAGWALVWVAVAPAYYLVAWVICSVVAGNAPGATILAWQWPAAPWVVLCVEASLRTSAVLPVAVLSCVLVLSVGGFALGARACFRATRAGLVCLVTTLAVSLALIGTAAGQIAAYGHYVVTYTGALAVSDEVDLANYTPFAPGNLLVKPATRPSISISGDYPRLDGATALYPLYAAAAQALYRVPAAMTDDQRRAFVADTVACSGTSDAYARLVSGDADAVVAAPPSQQQKDAAAAAGVDLVLTPLGREAFVFIVNADNPVDGLTQAQVRDIYTKKITNWKSVGGPDERILPYQRPVCSGSQTAMLALVMQGQAMAAPLREEVSDGMGDVVNQVIEYHNTEGAIGYSFRWYVTTMNPVPGLKLLAIDGVAPTVENIRNGTYPLTGDFYSVTNGAPTGQTKALIDWLTGPEGQALVEQVGYVGV